MPFGVKCASAIFQREIEKTLEGMTHVLVRADDVLVTGETDDDHLQHLEDVLPVWRKRDFAQNYVSADFLNQKFSLWGT